MLTETARVIGEDGSTLVLELNESTGCSQCSANKICGHKLLVDVHSNKKRHISIAKSDFKDQQINHSDGTININLEEKKFLALTSLFYLFPLALMLFFAMLADTFLEAELAVILASLSGLGLGFLSLSGITRRVKLTF